MHDCASQRPYPSRVHFTDEETEAEGGQFSSELWYQDPEAWRAEDRRSGPSLSIPGTMERDGGLEAPGRSWR